MSSNRHHQCQTPTNAIMAPPRPSFLEPVVCNLPATAAAPPFPLHAMLAPPHAPHAALPHANNDAPLAAAGSPISSAGEMDTSDTDEPMDMSSPNHNEEPAVPVAPRQNAPTCCDAVPVPAANFCHNCGAVQIDYFGFMGREPWRQVDNLTVRRAVIHPRPVREEAVIHPRPSPEAPKQKIPIDQFDPMSPLWN